MHEFWRLILIRRMPDLVALLATLVSLMVILDRVTAAARSGDADLYQSAFGGFPVSFGLMGAAFVAVSISLRPRTTADAGKLRAAYKASESTYAAIAIAKRDFAWGFAEAVDKELAELESRIALRAAARESAVQRYETLGTYALLAATVMAFINWALGVA